MSRWGNGLIGLAVLGSLTGCVASDVSVAAEPTHSPNGEVRSVVGTVSDYDVRRGRVTLAGGTQYFLPGPESHLQLPGGLVFPPRIGETIHLAYREEGSRNVIRSLEPETPQNNM